MAVMEEGVPAPAQHGTVVQATEITRRYGEGATAVDALRGVSLGVESGQLVAVMGPSGSGKSTLMHILAGLDKPTTGTVEIAGIEITTLNDGRLTRLRRQHIGFVFQFFNLLPMLTAEENVVLPLTIAGEKPEQQWLEDLLEQTGLTDRRKHRPSELSGGQQQRVSLARALANRPAIVWADEPTGALDTETSAGIMDLMVQLNRQNQQTFVWVTHSEEVGALAQRLIRMRDGLVVSDVKEAPYAMDGSPSSPLTSLGSRVD